MHTCFQGEDGGIPLDDLIGLGGDARGGPPPPKQPPGVCGYPPPSGSSGGGYPPPGGGGYPPPGGGYPPPGGGGGGMGYPPAADNPVYGAVGPPVSFPAQPNIPNQPGYPANNPG